MRKLKCGECGKNYDFDVDDFCPRCGAYTHPVRSGAAARVDGISERNHENSFLHRELHTEDDARRGTPLSKKPKESQSSAVRDSVRDSLRESSHARSEKRQLQAFNGLGKVLIAIIIGLAILTTLLGN